LWITLTNAAGGGAARAEAAAQRRPRKSPGRASVRHDLLRRTAPQLGRQVVVRGALEGHGKGDDLVADAVDVLVLAARANVGQQLQLLGQKVHLGRTPMHTSER